MINSINQFRTSLGYVKNLGGLYTKLSHSTTPVLDLSDILRSELVMGVSALDHFIHSTVEEGIIEIYQGIRTRTAEYQNFKVTLDDLQHAVAFPTDIVWLIDRIRANIGYQSFQKSEKISNSLKLISSKDIWNEVAIIMQSDKNQLKLELDLIVERRNKIAHEADLYPPYPYQRWSISETMVNRSINHIEQVCESIFQVVK